MKRVRQSDINFKLNTKLINLSDFSIKFYTVNSTSFFIRKNQDDVIPVEREATIYDEDIIESGGTVAFDYYIKLDWSELKNIGEGVLQYQAINNTFDTDYPDTYYNKRISKTTEYYIDSDIIIEPDGDKTYQEMLEELDERISAEVVDRTAADEALSGAIETTFDNITNLVNDEVSRATSAETALDAKIDEEIARATSAETELNLAILAETDRATTRENALTDLINALRQDLTDESEIRSSADTTIWAAINGEVNRATAAETALDTRIDNLTSATTAQDNAISGKLDTYIVSNDSALSAVSTALSNEVARATAVESGLTGSISSEVSRATGEESRIETKIDNYIVSNNTALSNEITRAISAETALSGRIDVLTGITDVIYGETIRASRAEEALSGAIDSISAATSGDVAELAEAINNEVTRATSVEDEISATVVSNYTTLSTAIGDETTRAEGVESALSGAIDTKLSIEDFNDYSAVTKTAIDSKLDASAYTPTDLSNYYTKAETYNKNEVDAAIEAIDIADQLSGYVQTSAFTAYSASVESEIEENELATSEAINDINSRIINIVDKIDENELATSEAINDLNSRVINIVDNTYSKSEVDEAIADIDVSDQLSGYVQTSAFTTYSAATAAEINSKQDAGNFVSADTYNAYTAKTDNDIISISGVLDTKLDASAYTPTDLSNYYTKSEVYNKNEVDAAIASIDISGYVETSAFTAYSASVATEIEENELATSEAINDINSRLINIVGEIDDNELATSEAINDLNSRVINIVDNTYTKAEVDAAIADIVITGSTSGYVETSAFTEYSAATKTEIDSKLDASAYTPTDLSNYYTKSEVYTKNEVDTAIANIDVTDQLSGYVETSVFTAFSANVDSDIVAISGVVDTKLDATAYTPTDLSNYYTKSEIDNSLSGKQETLIAGDNITISGNVISASSGETITIDPSLNTGSTNAVANSAITTALNNKANKTAAVGSYVFGTTNNTPYIRFKMVNAAQALSDIYYPYINGKGILSSNSTWAQNNYNFQLVETSAITTSITSGSTDSQIPSAKAVFDSLSGYVETSAFTAFSGDVTTAIGYDEQITSEAINDLNSRVINIVDNTYSKTYIDALEARIEALETYINTLKANNIDKISATYDQGTNQYYIGGGDY